MNTKSWQALLKAVETRGLLFKQYDSSCARLNNGIVIADKSEGFTDKDFHRSNHEYRLLGMRLVWVVSKNTEFNTSLRDTYSKSFLTLDGNYVWISGLRYPMSVVAGYLATGEVDASLAVSHRKHGSMLSDGITTKHPRKLPVALTV